MKKHSKKRDAVAEAICVSKKHPSADDIYAALKADFPSLSLGTVYRNIAMLKSEGVIKSVGTVSGIERFDGDLSDHPHFICEACGTVLDVAHDGAGFGDAKEIIARKYGVEVTHRHFVYYGKCGECLDSTEILLPAQ